MSFFIFYNDTWVDESFYGILRVGVGAKWLAMILKGLLCFVTERVMYVERLGLSSRV